MHIEDRFEKISWTIFSGTTLFSLASFNSLDWNFSKRCSLFVYLGLLREGSNKRLIISYIHILSIIAQKFYKHKIDSVRNSTTKNLNSVYQQSLTLSTNCILLSAENSQPKKLRKISIIFTVLHCLLVLPCENL